MLKVTIHGALTALLTASLLLAAAPISPVARGAGEAQSAADYPCTLLSTNEVAAVFGAPYHVTSVIALGPGENNHPGMMCNYATDDQQFPSLFTLAVLRASDVAGDEGRVRATFEEVKSDWTDSASVPGLGDDAFFNLLGLHVLQGDVYVSVGMTNTRPGSADATAEQLWPLARKVLDRTR